FSVVSTATLDHTDTPPPHWPSGHTGRRHFSVPSAIRRPTTEPRKTGVAGMNTWYEPVPITSVSPTTMGDDQIRFEVVVSIFVVHFFAPVARFTAYTFEASPAMYTVSAATNGEGVSMLVCRRVAHTIAPVFASTALSQPA